MVCDFPWQLKDASCEAMHMGHKKKEINCSNPAIIEQLDDTNGRSCDTL